MQQNFSDSRRQSSDPTTSANDSKTAIMNPQKTANQYSLQALHSGAAFYSEVRIIDIKATKKQYATKAKLGEPGKLNLKARFEEIEMEDGQGSGGLRRGDWTSPPRIVFGDGFGRPVRDDERHGLAEQRTGVPAPIGTQDDDPFSDIPSPSIPLQQDHSKNNTQTQHDDQEGSQKSKNSSKISGTTATAFRHTDTSSVYSLYTALSNFSKSENTEEEVRNPSVTTSEIRDSVTTSENRDSVVYISETPILQQILRPRRPSQPKKKKRCTSMRILIVTLILAVIAGIVFLCLYFTGVLPSDRYESAHGHGDDDSVSTIVETITAVVITYTSTLSTSTSTSTISPNMLWIPTPTYTAAFAPLPVRTSTSVAPLMMTMDARSAGIRLRGSLAMVLTVVVMGSWGLIQVVAWILVGLICSMVDEAIGWFLDTMSQGAIAH